MYKRIRIHVGEEKFETQRGVMQGAPISPYLFNIYVEDLIEKIKKEGTVREECILINLCG